MVNPTSGSGARNTDADTIPDVDGCEAFVRSFDLSKFPNLQEVHLLVDWVGGDLLWIPTALSTLKPTTSPRLLAVRLSFICPLVTNRPEGTIEYTGNDLRQVVDEVIRIEREFEGAVQLTVNRDSAFETVLDKLNVRFDCRGWTQPLTLVDSFSFLQRYC